MPLTAGAVIDAARDYHGALSKQNAPDRLAWPQLTRFMNTLMNRILGRMPAFFAQTYVATLNSALFTNGLALATISSIGVKGLAGDIQFTYNASDPDRFVPGRFIPWEQRDLYTPVPAYTLRNNVIYLLAGDGGIDLATAYQNFSAMTVSYTPSATAIVNNDTELAGFPDDALEVFATNLAGFLLRRMVGNPQWGVERADADYFDAQAREAREDFLTRLTRGITQQANYYVRDVGP